MFGVLRSGRGPTFGEKAAVYRSPGSTGSLAALMRAERGVDKGGAGGKKVCVCVVGGIGRTVICVRAGLSFVCCVVLCGKRR